ncbi:hypothetical protein F5Y17DRAFT_431000 [Xylariaceae sp. FL0594]|nr:hypothetical protein F5Y17DRAFT_431000 [Xylariaceae sp. FL0594]
MNAIQDGKLVKLRAACDGCNESKVRCSQTRPSCVRCMRQGVPCVYGLSRRSHRKAPRVGASSSSHLAASNLDAALLHSAGITNTNTNEPITNASSTSTSTTSLEGAIAMQARSLMPMVMDNLPAGFDSYIRSLTDSSSSSTSSTSSSRCGGGGGMDFLSSFEPAALNFNFDFDGGALMMEKEEQDDSSTTFWSAAAGGESETDCCSATMPRRCSGSEEGGGGGGSGDHHMGATTTTDPALLSLNMVAANDEKMMMMTDDDDNNNNNNNNTNANTPSSQSLSCSCNHAAVQELLVIPFQPLDQVVDMDATMSRLKQAVKVADECVGCVCITQDEMSIGKKTSIHPSFLPVIDLFQTLLLLSLVLLVFINRKPKFGARIPHAQRS